VAFKIRGALVAAGALLFLGGCAGMELEKARSIEPGGDRFEQALNSGYIDLSSSEFDEGDYQDSDAFALRAEGAATGKPSAPEAVAARGLPADAVDDLAAARARLMAAFEKGARDKLPDEAARAQVMYECWMEEQEENFQPEDIAACRGGFETAMIRIETALAPKPVAAAPAPAPSPAPAPPPAPVAAAEPVPAPKPPPGPFVLMFDFDSAKIEGVSQEVIDRIAAAAKAYGPAKIELAAHTDRAGSDAYNDRLAEMRALAVKMALAQKGVPVPLMDVRVFGERKVPVATPDGVPEERNRVVIVTFGK